MAEWTTENLRRMVVAHVSNVWAWEHPGVAMTEEQRQEIGAQFDSSLAAHDAEVRAKAVQEFTANLPDGTEWLEEYTAGVRANAVEDAADRLECAWAQQTPGSPLGTVQTVQWLRDRARAERGEA